MEPVTESGTPGASASLLERNLCALGGRSSAAIERIRRAGSPGVGRVVLERAPDGGLSGSVRGEDGAWRRLGSGRGPRAEGAAWARGQDVMATAGFAVRGFGLGHHVGALVERLRGQGHVIVFEPDVELLRGVLEREDHTRWLPGCAIVVDAEDAGALARAVQGMEGVLSAGTAIVDHPASAGRLGVGRAGSEADRFGRAFADVMRAVRTSVVTTMVQVEATARNLLQNLGWYATRRGIADLRGAARGCAGIVVSAGPSLARNVDLLKRVGDRAVVIATQTTLKPLLARGIRPRFVTALDYHAISARFYEGLSAADVEGIELVVEPKANPAILKAWPGSMRVVGDGVLERVLGPGLARPMGALPAGATVAHLSYYLGRFLGCDPMILVGQDLGFTDGQYYAAGASIHRVWSGELGAFTTLEMREWERVARMGVNLRRVRDQRGRAMFTDEQMATYLVQFERDFAADAARGLSIIDATEGGVAKRHTEAMPLAEAIERYVETREGVSLPRGGAWEDASSRMERTKARVEELRLEAGRVERVSREAEGLLERIERDMPDRSRRGAVNGLIERVQGLGSKASGSGAFWLVQFVNQTGQFNRFKADRRIAVADGLGEIERELLRTRRDRTNVRWLADAARQVGRLLEDAGTTLRTGEPMVEDPEPMRLDDGEAGTGSGSGSGARAVWGVVMVGAGAGLGVPTADRLGGGQRWHGRLRG